MTTTAMTYPVLRPALFLAMLAVCFAALQCTAESSVPNTNGNSVVSKVAGGLSGRLPSGNSGISNVIGTSIFNYCTRTGNCTVTVRTSPPKSSSVGNPLPTVAKQTPDEGHERTDPKATKTTAPTEKTVLDTNAVVGGSSSSSSSLSSSSSSSFPPSGVSRGSQSDLLSDGLSSSSRKTTLAGPEVTPATTTTTANAGIPARQEEALTRDAFGDTSVKKGNEQVERQTTTEENSNGKSTSSQATAPDTSVKTLMSTSSTSAPKDNPQTSVTSTTESAKGEFTATEKLLPNLSKVVQSAGNKDGNVGYSSVFALSALVTVVVMAIAPSF